MPMHALRPCSYPGCLNLVRAGRCAEHRQPDPYHDPAIQALYNSARWQAIRRAQLAMSPWCEECLRANIWTIATDVDHITPHRGDPLKFFAGPFQNLCHACHSRKTAQEVFA